ncbi:IS66 family insertion sequence element accessory protein TnpB [Clostridium sp. MCC353]|uniref:IS66 family insertion sequence element accessory protein TnpB n=1 Tax=Clostridium sp. MCC353 TaxID=2592646 RepID=UPI001C01588D
MTASKHFYGKVMVFLLIYKCLDNGAFNWTRSKAEAVTISEDQFQMLMQGLEIIAKHPISEMADPTKAM